MTSGVICARVLLQCGLHIREDYVSPSPRHAAARRYREICELFAEAQQLASRRSRKCRLPMLDEVRPRWVKIA